MSLKSWIIPYVSFAVGIGFTAYSFISGNPVDDSMFRFIDYLIIMTLGSGAIGATKSGYDKYQEYKNNGT